jgi:iron complex outermembrane recepter protein
MYRKSTLASSGAMIAFILAGLAPAWAQQAPAASEPTAESEGVGEIIVTATKRAQSLSDVPIAVSAVTADALQNSGVTDIRQLNQLSPSLLVSSTSSEAQGGVARIRGIGTVGDNPGLESSVAVFIDGVYRSRTGSGLTDLGEVDRIEVLRGPQGTLFGRNASAGLLNVITKGPEFSLRGYADATYGNYNFMRFAGGVTGPLIEDKLAARLDGVYQKRDGFIKDALSGARYNNRDRWLLRGQLLFTPTDDLDVRVIADYADRREDCCASVYLPGRTVTPGPNGSITTTTANSIVSLLSGPPYNGYFNFNAADRKTAITPGQSYRQNVKDWGLSAEINYRTDFANLSSISAYRDWKLDRGQDADFNRFDLLHRDNQDQQFRTFTQELRAQGTIFDDRLDWLIGGYFASEKLTLSDNLKFGADYQTFSTALVAGGLPAALRPVWVGAGGYAGLRSFLNTAIIGSLQGASIPPAVSAPFAGAVSALVPAGVNFANRGVLRDSWRQESENWAIFTHNVLKVTEKLSLTVGLRYTNERKKLDASIASDNTACLDIVRGIGAVTAYRTANAANPVAAGAATAGLGILNAVTALPCLANLNTVVDGVYSSRKKEDQLTGTGVISYKVNDDLMTYVSYSKGYKAGGFNLDRSGMTNGLGGQPRPSAEQLKFEPEKVDAWELGAKWSGPGISVNPAMFRQIFSQFQLNTFNGVNFLVENVQSCRDELNGADRDLIPASGACPGKIRGGVRTQGVEAEVFAAPADGLTVTTGVTVADTRYRNNLVGVGGRPLPAALFQLPGSAVSNAPLYVVTGSAAYERPLFNSSLMGMAYIDFRYQSEINSGSDKDIEKFQDGVFVMNARIGVGDPDKRWSVEFWAQNLLNTTYQQVAFDAPLQPPGAAATGAVQRGLAASTNALYGAFMAEPRTFGVTVRGKF